MLLELGVRLRRAREQLRLTRAEVVGRLADGGSAISTQTLTTYELGTRVISVPRLVQLCRALEADPSALLGDVLAQATPHTPHLPDRVCARIDLHQLAASDDPALAPLRRWATGQIDADRTVIHLDRPTIESAAVVCGMAPAQIRRALAPHDQEHAS